MLDLDFMALRLGRLPALDFRDRRHMMVARKPVHTFRSWLTPGPTMDQGFSSQCVAYAWMRLLGAHPVVNHPLDPATIYAEAQRVDEWEGEDYEGTSVRAGAKVLQARGFLTGYAWADNVDTVVNHVLTKGPAVMGTTWHWDMFTPDRFGYIHPGGGNAGGHSYILPVVNTERSNPDGSKGAARIENSWGDGWGEGGRAWISFRDLGALIEDWGEACAPTEVKAPAL